MVASLIIHLGMGLTIGCINLTLRRDVVEISGLRDAPCVSPLNQHVAKRPLYNVYSSMAPVFMT